MTSIEIVTNIAKILDDKKAIDTTVLDIRELTSLGDYFVITSGGSTTQVKALCGEIEDKLTSLGLEPRRVEGENSAMWILMDYSDVIVHIFYHETRDFYCLERLWADAKKMDLSDIIK